MKKLEVTQPILDWVKIVKVLCVKLEYMTLPYNNIIVNIPIEGYFFEFV